MTTRLPPATPVDVLISHERFLAGRERRQRFAEELARQTRESTPDGEVVPAKTVEPDPGSNESPRNPDSPVVQKLAAWRKTSPTA
jgi:hypothetical protein